jgi:hypothetical protein
MTQPRTLPDENYEQDPHDLLLLELGRFQRAIAAKARVYEGIGDRGPKPKTPIAEKWFEHMFANLADTGLYLVLIRQRLSRLQELMVDDPVWNIRRHIENPKVNFGKQPPMPIGCEKEWVTDRRYFKAQRVSPYAFNCRMGEVDSEGRYQKRYQRRATGWPKVTLYARQWLTGTYDDASAQAERDDLSRKRQAAVNKRWKRKAKPKGPTWRSPTPGGYFESLQAQQEYDSVSKEEGE